MAQFRHFAVRDEAIDMVAEAADELKLKLIPDIASLDRPEIPIHLWSGLSRAPHHRHCPAMKGGSSSVQDRWATASTIGIR